MATLRPAAARCQAAHLRRLVAQAYRDCNLALQRLAAERHGALLATPAAPFRYVALTRACAGDAAPADVDVDGGNGADADADIDADAGDGFASGAERTSAGDAARAIPAATFHRQYALCLHTLELTFYGYCVERQFGWERRLEAVFSTRPPSLWRRVLRRAPLLAFTLQASDGVAGAGNGVGVGAGFALARRAAPKRAMRAAPLEVRLDADLQAELAQLHASASASASASAAAGPASARAPVARLLAWLRFWRRT